MCAKQLITINRMILAIYTRDKEKEHESYEFTYGANDGKKGG